MPEDTRPKAVVFDIDGTLSDYRHRAHHITPPKRDWPGFFAEMEDDGLIEECFQMVLEAQKAGYKVIILTGRPDTYLQKTLRWLEKHAVLHDAVFLRPADDWRPGAILKAEIYEKHIAPFYNVIKAVDDNPKIIAMWQALGIPTVFIGSDENPETY